MDWFKDFYAWVSLQSPFVHWGMVFLLAALGLYVLGWMMSLLFWSYLRKTEDPSTRYEITEEKRCAIFQNPCDWRKMNRKQPEKTGE